MSLASSVVASLSFTSCACRPSSPDISRPASTVDLASIGPEAFSGNVSLLFALCLSSRARADNLPRKAPRVWRLTFPSSPVSVFGK